MLTKLHEAIILIFMLAAFIFGRMSVSVPQTAVTDEVKNNHTVVTTVTTKSPTGDIKTIRTIDSTTKKIDRIIQPTESNKSHRLTNLSLLAGYDFMSIRHLTPTYGLGVSREVLGPVTIGAYGFTSGLIGISVGVNF